MDRGVYRKLSSDCKLRCYLIDFYGLVPDVHLLDLLAMGDGVEFDIFLFHEILQHIRDFAYRIRIEIIDGFVEEEDRGVDVR